MTLFGRPLFVNPPEHLRYPAGASPYGWVRRSGENMPIQWMKDVDAALAEARAKNKPLLIDFNAAPM